MIMKFQDNLGHFSSMCQTGQENVLQVCPNHCSDPNVCSWKIIMMSTNTSKVSNMMQDDQDYSTENYVYEEISHYAKLKSDSFMVFLQIFFWLFSFCKSVCCNSKLLMLDYAPPSLMDSLTFVSSNFSPLLELQHCVSSKPLSLITFQNRSFPPSISR